MKLPVRAWSETLAALGFTRKKAAKAADNKRRPTRRPQLEALEARRMMTATLYWAGGSSGTWNNSTTNWATTSGGAASSAWSAGDIAKFGTTASVTIAADVSASEIDFTANNCTVSGSTLDMAGGGTIDVSSGYSATISATIADPSGGTTNPTTKRASRSAHTRKLAREHIYRSRDDRRRARLQTRQHWRTGEQFRREQRRRRHT